MPDLVTHHESGLPALDVGGERRVLACLPKYPTSRFAAYRGRIETMPRSEWKETSWRQFVLRIMDQNGQGSCVGHGSIAAKEIARGIAGMTPRRLSPCFTYGLINGGRDNGAVVSDAWDALYTSGSCLESTVGPKNIYRRNFPQAAFDEAKRFKGFQSESISTFDELCTAIQLGEGGVSFGIEIGNSFDPDNQGIIPRQRGGGGGHCMCALGLKQINGSWYLEVQNSWGNWGLNGYCWMPESYFDDGDLDAWLIAVEAEDPQDTDGPPVVIA